MKRAFPALLLFLLAALRAEAATSLFSLAIGHNGLPPGASGENLSVLSFADDDALAVHSLASSVARKAVVLALPDRATQARFPASREARPPSLLELRRALAELRDGIVRAAAAGDETAVWIFYSGHGWLSEDGRSNLALADGLLSQDLLYDEVLPALPARTVHLMIDACHAEALLRSRDLTAETVEVSPSQIAYASLRQRLERLPGVGVMMASASNTQAHEWEEYQTGVFTHELLSGLRGGADVNSDGRVEYSEVAAFLAAANREVADPRARLTTLVVAPSLYPRVPILDTRNVHTLARLQGRAHHLGKFRIDDERGHRLLDLRAESGFFVNLVVPAGDRLLLSNEAGETWVRGSTHAPIDLESLTMNKSTTRQRSATAESLRRGLFAAEFGPSYYGGYMDSADSKMTPVEIGPMGVRVATSRPTRARDSIPFWTGTVVTGASIVATGVLASLAGKAYADCRDAELERPSLQARDRFELYRNLAIGTGALAVVSGALSYWLYRRADKGEDLQLAGQNGAP